MSAFDDELEGVLNETANRPDPVGEKHSGQARMAYRLAAAADGHLMHVHGLGWHAYDGARWVEDHRGAAKRAVLTVLQAALADSLGDKDLRADVRKCESAAGIAGVLDIAAALEEFAFTVTDLDADPHLLNTAAGTLDLRTFEVRAHDPEDRITKVARGSYLPGSEVGAGSPWDEFLAEVLPDAEVRGFLQRVSGIGLLGVVREHLLPILTGTGANGKGVFYGAYGWALGDYSMVAEPDLLMHRDGAHPTGEMDLRGVRWAVVSESDEGRRLAEATVKRLTGGDEIKARRMRQDFVSFIPSHTAVLVTNHLPRVSGDDAALWRRLRVVPFDVVIPPERRDAHLPERLQLAADAVLTWAIEGYRDYAERGGLDEPESVRLATDDYQRASDALSRFISECCLTFPAMTAPVGDLWERWTHWRADDGAEEISKKAFGEALDRRGFAVHRGGKGARIRRGIGLLSEEDEPC